MSDPISSQSVQRAAKLAEQLQQAQESTTQAKPGQFEQVLDKVGQKGSPDSTQAVGDSAKASQVDPQEKTRLVLEEDLATRIGKMPPEERAQHQQRYEIEIAPLKRSEQVEHHAVRIEQCDRSRVALERNAKDLPESPWKEKLIDRLEDFQTHQTELDQFMQDFARGKEFSQQELLAMQIQTHQMSQSVELLSKTVEHTVSGMKTIFQTNV